MEDVFELAVLVALGLVVLYFFAVYLYMLYLLHVEVVKRRVKKKVKMVLGFDKIVRFREAVSGGLAFDVYVYNGSKFEKRGGGGLEMYWCCGLLKKIWVNYDNDKYFEFELFFGFLKLKKHLIHKKYVDIR